MKIDHELAEPEYVDQFGGEVLFSTERRGLQKDEVGNLIRGDTMLIAWGATLIKQYRNNSTEQRYTSTTKNVRIIARVMFLLGDRIKQS